MNEKTAMSIAAMAKPIATTSSASWTWEYPRPATDGAMIPPVVTIATVAEPRAIRSPQLIT